MSPPMKIFLNSKHLSYFEHATTMSAIQRAKYAANQRQEGRLDQTQRESDAREVAGAEVKDISLSKVRKFTAATSIKYGVISATRPRFLTSLNLMRANTINNDGILFFAKDISQFIIHAQVMLVAFKDNAGTVLFDRKEIRSNLFTQFEEAEFFIKRHLSLQAIIESTRRHNVYEIPQAAWREALANAIVHRDYKTTGTSVQVSIYPNRIEICNLGSLPDGVTTGK
jgi:ATP-dependent DNA helicase RecG